MKRQTGEVKKSPGVPEVGERVPAAVGSIIVAHLVYGANDREIETFKLTADSDTNRHSDDSIAHRSIGSPVGESVIRRAAGDNSFFLTPDGSVVGVEIRSVEQPEGSTARKK